MDQDQITARHLEVFFALITSTGLKEAAEKLNCSIPAVSKTIRFLERCSQAPLFIKVGGRLQATAEAEALMPSIRTALEHMEFAKRELLNASKTEVPRLRVGVGGGALPYLVPETIRRCREEMPNLVVEMITNPTQRLLYLISNHQIDLAVTTPPPQNTDINLLSLCDFTEITETPLVVVVPRSHALTKRSVVRPHDLIGNPLITLYEKSPTVSLVSAAFRDAGEKLEVSIQANNSISVCYLVNTGAGVGLIHPEALGRGAFPNLVKIDFLPRISMKTFLYLPKNQVRTELTSFFTSILRGVCANQ
ncbi:LysR family transcriptional regulator [Pseudomonas sp. NA-150]|uniref:LysR family transcriptional regulator n=1 Tax=Pseudomonas sp. NA-150 TaxID=3367525 RepID=UPI0037C634B9